MACSRFGGIPPGKDTGFVRFRWTGSHPRAMCCLVILLMLFAGFSCGKRSVTSPDGVRINCRVYGRGEPTIVFVHGWCCDRTFWKYQASYFASRCTVVTLDLAGHGGSGRNRKDWTLEAYAGDVQAVVEGLGLTRVILVGHSMGGPIALEAARRMPGRVIGIVGADTFHRFTFPYTREYVMESFAPLRQDFSAAMRAVAASMFSPRADSALVGTVAGFMAKADTSMALSSAQNYFFWQIDHYAEAAAEVSVPIRAIIGEDSPDWGDLDGENNRRIHPRFEVKVMPDAGHFVMLESPDRFNQYLEEYVKSFSKWDPEALRETGKSVQPVLSDSPDSLDEGPVADWDEEE